MESGSSIPRATAFSWFGQRGSAEASEAARSREKPREVARSREKPRSCEIMQCATVRQSSAPKQCAPQCAPQRHTAPHSATQRHSAPQCAAVRRSVPRSAAMRHSAPQCAKCAKPRSPFRGFVASQRQSNLEPTCPNRAHFLAVLLGLRTRRPCKSKFRVWTFWQAKTCHFGGAWSGGRVQQGPSF